MRRASAGTVVPLHREVKTATTPISVSAQPADQRFGTTPVRTARSLLIPSVLSLTAGLQICAWTVGLGFE
jgi:hypothetical protein